MAIYQYINKSGKPATFDAPDQQTALKTLGTMADRDPNSGVQMLNTPSPTTAPTPTPTTPSPAPAVTSSDEIRNAQAKTTTDQAKTDAENAAELSRLTVMKNLQDVRASLEPTNVPKPVTPSLESSYQSLVSGSDGSGHSLNDYQTALAENQKKQDEIKSGLVSYRKDLSKGQSQGTFLGQFSATEQEAQDKLDSLNREAIVLSTNIQNRNDVIQSLMGFKQQDYTNASNEYDKEFSKNITLLNYLTTQQAREDAAADKKTAATDKATDNARANLQIIQGQIQSGNVSYDDLDPLMKTTIANLEVQAGFPAGFTKFINQNVKGDVLATTTRTDSTGGTYYDVLTRDPSGKLTTTSVYAGNSKVSGSGSGDEESTIKSFQSDVASAILRIDKDATAYDAEFRALKAKYPEASDQLIHAKLGASQ